jgi:alkylation response protein AidB-like acyl-CoA dehydrogenase
MDHDSRAMLLETADRFFADRVGKDVVNGVEKGQWPADLWREIEEMGLPLVAVPEDKGGAAARWPTCWQCCAWPARMPCRAAGRVALATC